MQRRINLTDPEVLRRRWTNRLEPLDRKSICGVLVHRWNKHVPRPEDYPVGQRPTLGIY